MLSRIYLFCYRQQKQLLTSRDQAGSFPIAEAQATRLLEEKNILPAFDYTLKASHLFNLLDARGVVSPTERQSFIASVRTLAKGCAEAWAANESKAGEAA